MSRQRPPAATGLDALINALAAIGMDASHRDPSRSDTSHQRIESLRRGIARSEHAARTGPAAEHEATRAIAELGALALHAMIGGNDPNRTNTPVERPNDDPIIALSLSRQRLSEYARGHGIARALDFPGPRVWLIEVEHARRDTPSTIAVWRSRSPTGEACTRCACVWIHDTGASPSHPLVVGARWDRHGGGTIASACVIGPSPTVTARASAKVKRSGTLEQRKNAMTNKIVNNIAYRAALAWHDAHAGHAPATGSIRAIDTSAATAHTQVRCTPAPQPGSPPAWLDTEPRRGIEAIVIEAAREGWRLGPGNPVSGWRTGWAGLAEAGAIGWTLTGHPPEPIATGTWNGVARGLAEGEPPDRAHAHPALGALAALVHTMLSETGRQHIAHDPDKAGLYALQIPAALWRALRSTGATPAGLRPHPLGTEWWIVEIERPGAEDPNTIALWHDSESNEEIALAAFLCADGTRRNALSIATWRTRADGTTAGAAVAMMRCPPHIHDPADPEREAAMHQVVEMLSTPDTGPIARAKIAIALQVANHGEGQPLQPYRRAAPSESAKVRPSPPRAAPMQDLFALDRAPEPLAARPDNDKISASGSRASPTLSARQVVSAHLKHQAFGPKLARRRWIVIEHYHRGPTPREDQIAVTRLAENELERTGGPTGKRHEPSRGKQRHKRSRTKRRRR